MRKPYMRNLQAKMNENLEAIRKRGLRVAIVFEGRDSAGKTSGIREITKHAPRDICRTYTMSKPSKTVMASWLKSWVKNLPKKGEVVFFDRSWYSRAIVHPLNVWCSKKQYRNFMKKVAPWEDNQEVHFIKIWANINQSEQAKRLNLRKVDPLRYWKFSENDKLSLTNYDACSLYLNQLLSNDSSWKLVNFMDKEASRITCLEIINEQLEVFLNTNKLNKKRRNDQ